MILKQSLQVCISLHTWFSRKAINVYAVRASPLAAPPCMSWWITFPTSEKLPFAAWFMDNQRKASWIMLSSILIYGIACWKDLTTNAVSLKRKKIWLLIQSIKNNSQFFQLSNKLSFWWNLHLPLFIREFIFCHFT